MDPAFHFKADADPDPAFHLKADPDPALLLSDGIIEQYSIGTPFLASKPLW